MNRNLLYIFIFLSNSLFADNINDQLAESCGRYAKVLTKDYEFSQYIKSSSRDVRKILIRDIVSPDVYRSELEALRPKSFLGQLTDNNCFNFYPVESKLAKNFKKKEALFIHYNSKYEIKIDGNVSSFKEHLKLIEEEALLVLTEMKKFAENISLNYIVIRPASQVIQTIDGEPTVLKSTFGKNFNFYTHNYEDWLKE
jgi:hypothetical protein